MRIDCRYISKALVITLLLLFSCLVIYSQATAEMRIFELQNRPAGALAEMVRSLLDDGSKVAAHQNTLVVNASPDELATVARLVASYDRAQRMLRITVAQGQTLDDHSRELSVSGKLHEGRVSVDLGSKQRENSSVRLGSSRSQVNLQAQDSSRQENRQVSQFLTVMEGYPARISVGRSVPFTSQMRSYCRRHPTFVETIDYQHVDTGFEVLPTVFDNMAQLEIRPFMAFLDTQNPKQIVFQELATQVRIPLGTWYELGASLNSQDGLSREILAGGRQSSSSGSSMRLRVDPE